MVAGVGRVSTVPKHWDRFLGKTQAIVYKPMTDLERDLIQINENYVRYALPQRYYAGDHDLAFATEKFINAFGKLFREFALNLCPVIIDAVVNKLSVDGFQIEAGDKDLEQELWQIWQSNRMDLRSSEIHREAMISGDAYIMIWPDASGIVRIYPQRPDHTTITYDAERPGEIIRAAKIWNVDDATRLNIYYPDRIERYIAADPERAKRESTFWRPQIKFLFPEAKRFKTYDADGLPAVLPNPYNRVPIFHFTNDSMIGNFGESELRDIIPVQNGLNKAVLDMLVAMEFSAFRQRWIAGIEIEYDESGNPKAPFKSGAERLWLTESPETRFGDFDATDLKQFLEVKNSFVLDIARISGLPLWYVDQTATPPSGESLRRAESRFHDKIRSRQQSFGYVWADAMAFAFAIQTEQEPPILFTRWVDPASQSTTERLNELLLKQQIGVSQRQLLTEAGYGEADIERIMQEREAEIEAQQTAFDRGQI